MQERDIDIVIIGSGSAGLNAMAQARAAGRSFVLINGGEPGTTCARIGCMPSKVMIHIAEEYYRRTHFGQFVIDGHEGLELGQSLARMGVTITGFDQVERIAGITDPEVNRCAIELMRKEFAIHLGATATIAAEDGKLRVSAGGHEVLVDKVLSSIGRVPMVEGLGLEALGLPLDARGVPPFDPRTMQVGDLPVFLAGDVTGERQVLHESTDEGKIAGYNAAHVGEAPFQFQRKSPFYVNFCDPNIIAVGARYDEIDTERSAIGEVSFSTVGRARAMGQARGEHLGHLLAWAIEQRMTVGECLRMPFYHPVIEGALKAALSELYAKIDAKNPGPVTEVAPAAN